MVFDPTIRAPVGGPTKSSEWLQLLNNTVDNKTRIDRHEPLWRTARQTTQLVFTTNLFTLFQDGIFLDVGKWISYSFINMQVTYGDNENFEFNAISELRRFPSPSGPEVVVNTNWEQGSTGNSSFSQIVRRQGRTGNAPGTHVFGFPIVAMNRFSNNNGSNIYRIYTQIIGTSGGGFTAPTEKRIISSHSFFRRYDTTP